VALVRGRFFDAHDRAPQSDAVMINASLARRRFGAIDPVGRRISLTRGETWRTIVGVVGDLRHQGLDQAPRETIYLPFRQYPGFSSALLVRTFGDPMALADPIGRLVRRLDGSTAVHSARTLAQVRAEALAPPRLITSLLSVFAGLALAIAATGLSGVLAYGVAQRTREIGIRMALGAAAGQVVAMVLRQGLGAVLKGMALGLAGALALARLLMGLLFGVGPHDPACFVGSFAVLLIVAVLAALIPARRAVAILPVQALRTE
jgi:putative ABC transport system permease protein